MGSSLSSSGWFAGSASVQLSLRPLRPLCPMGAPTNRLPVEIWRDMLLFAIESDVGPSVFATTCTASTFIHFINQGKDSYIEYEASSDASSGVPRLHGTNSFFPPIPGGLAFTPQSAFNKPSTFHLFLINRPLSSACR